MASKRSKKQPAPVKDSGTRATFFLPPQLLLQLRIAALTRDCPASAIVAEALRRELTRGATELAAARAAYRGGA